MDDALPLISENLAAALVAGDRLAVDRDGLSAINDSINELGVAAIAGLDAARGDPAARWAVLDEVTAKLERIADALATVTDAFEVDVHAYEAHCDPVQDRLVYRPFSSDPWELASAEYIDSIDRVGEASAGVEATLLELAAILETWPRIFPEAADAARRTRAGLERWAALQQPLVRLGEQVRAIMERDA